MRARWRETFGLVSAWCLSAGSVREGEGAWRAQDFLEDGQEETGWKLVHGDVFRPPSLSGWLSVCVGTGVQVSPPRSRPP